MQKHGETIRAKIIGATINLWSETGKVPSVREIAKETNMTHSNVFYHFGDREGVVTEAAKQAIMDGNSKIIAQLILKKDRLVASMSETEKANHLIVASA